MNIHEIYVLQNLFICLCLDLYFECLDLYFECLDLYFGCLDLDRNGARDQGPGPGPGPGPNHESYPSYWINKYITPFYVFELGVPNQRACGASPTSAKTRPWNFGPCTLCILSFLLLLAWCAQSACLRRFADLKKTRPWDFGPCVLCFLLFFYVFLAWCAQSACLRRFADLRKNTTLEFWTMYPMYFVIFCCF